MGNLLAQFNQIYEEWNNALYRKLGELMVTQTRRESIAGPPVARVAPGTPLPQPAQSVITVPSIPRVIKSKSNEQVVEPKSNEQVVADASGPVAVVATSVSARPQSRSSAVA